MHRIFPLILAMTCLAPCRADEARYAARDTLRMPDDATAGTRKLHQAAGYTPAEFTVSVAEPAGGEPAADAIVRFPSPRPDPTAGEGVNCVVMEWYAARRDSNPLRRAPAVLVLHTLDQRLHVSQGIARVLASEGVHAFVMHSPGYGLRTYDRYRAWGDRFFERSGQSIADARRARDAIASIPAVEGDRVSVQGTSLGGFQAAAAASLDAVFDYNFIYLSGGDLHGVFTHGVREARWVRDSILRHGVTEAELPALCDPIDPARTAHVLNPARTWLFSARSDQVIPTASANALAEAIGLAKGHHVWLAGDHYTGLLHTEWVAREIAHHISDPAGVKP